MNLHKIFTIGLTLFILIHFYSFKSTAQNFGTIQGVISDNNIPVEFANVILTTARDSSKILQLNTSDSSGNFSFHQVQFDDYLLRVQAIGYIPVRIKFQLDSAHQQFEIPKIELMHTNTLLKGIEVVTQKNTIKRTAQGFIMNAADNITQTGGTATDLLKSTPTVVVDLEGGITIRGKTPLILINGRNSNLDATDRIPASSIESIEIINNPSAQYDADAEGGIINIKLKKNAARGTNGSVAVGGGMGARGRANSAVMINNKTKKWNIGFTYDNRFAERIRTIEANRTNYDLPLEYHLIQNRNDNRIEQTHNAKINMDYAPDSRNIFNFEVIGNLNGQDNDETLASTFKTQTDSFNNKNSRRSVEIERDKLAEFALNYNRKFKDNRRYLTASMSSSFNFVTANTDITTQSIDAKNANIGTSFLQRTQNYQNSNVTNLKVDYGYPVTRNGVIETGYKLITRNTRADFQSQYYANDAYVVNPLASNIFNFQEQIHAAYIQFKSFVSKQDSAKWKYNLGVRTEQVYNKGDAAANNIAFNNDYFHFFPTANIAYYISSNDFFKLSYSRRINRPSLGSLNPFVDITDSLSPHSGNPYLKPELINSFEGGYIKDWRKFSLSSILFYRYSTNIIRSFIAVQNNGVALSQPMNFGSATTYGYEGIATFFPSKYWSANASISFYQLNIDGSNISPEVGNNIFSWYGKLTNNFMMWKGSKLQIIANYNSPVGTPQGQRIAIYYADLGFQQKILRGKGGIGLVITDVLNTQRNGYTASGSNFYYQRYYKIDTRALLLTFVYTFGTTFKEEMIENKFSNE